MTVETPRPEFETITPLRAEQLLARMPLNRRLKADRVKALVSAIHSGDFDPYNGEAIKIDTNGNLVDGQHRLQAIIMSKTPQELLVVRGVKPESIYTVDTGTPRSLTDSLTLDGEVNVSYLATAIKGGWQYTRGNFGQPNSHTDSPSTVEARRFLAAHPTLRDSARAASRFAIRAGDYGKMLTPVVYGPLHWIFSKYNEAEADFFFDRVSIGDDLAQDNAIWALRRSVANLRSRTQGLGAYGPYMQAITIKAWNAWLEGRPIGHLRYNPGGKKPEPFPVILGHEVIDANIRKEAALRDHATI